MSEAILSFQNACYSADADHDGRLEGVREGRFKLHVPHGYRTMEGREPGGGGLPGKYDYSASIGLALFDMEADPSERQNVADVYPEIVERLLQEVERARTELGDRSTDRVGSGVRAPGRSVESGLSVEGGLGED